MEIVLLGQKGRDDALADRLKGHKLHVIGLWENPGLVDKAKASGGSYQTVRKLSDISIIADMIQAIKPDMFLTNAEDALEAGIVDEIKKRMPDVLVPCPDKKAAQIEWDKFDLREIIASINNKYNPINFMAVNSKQVNQAVEHFRSLGIEVVIKPRNLTGGKGVRVMGKHFTSYEQAKNYAIKVLESKNQKGVEIQEKLIGHEFTMQIFTDGQVMIKPPLTYDYPYREDGDKGPGTGGMGAFSVKDGLMPFLSTKEYEEVFNLSKQVLVKLKKLGRDYKGILYPSFFKTKDGIKIVEINARGGDPELINVIDLMEDYVDLGEVLSMIARGKLKPDSISYKKLASAMIYLVAPDYSYREDPSVDFDLNTEKIAANNCLIRFSAAERSTPGKYRTVKSSRVVGLSSLGRSPWEARQNIINAIEKSFNHPLSLHYRKQIADKAYIRTLVP